MAATRAPDYRQTLERFPGDYVLGPGGLPMELSCPVESGWHWLSQ